MTSELLSQYGGDTYKNPLNWDIVGLNIIVLLLQCLIFHAINLFIELGWLSSATKNEAENGLGEAGEDVDVAEERKRIPNQTDILQIKNLSKVFWKTFGKNCVAVNNITVGVKSGEVKFPVQQKS